MTASMKKICTIKNAITTLPICYTCVDIHIQEKAMKLDLEILSKLKYGSTKSKHETRLCRCLKCGVFRVVHPASLNGDTKYCGGCAAMEVENLLEYTEWKLVRKIDNKVEIECSCGNSQLSQVTNLRKYIPKCGFCGYSKDRPTFVYAFRIENQYGTFIKIGKSNNPYLRHLSFIMEGSVCTFIGQKEFKVPLDAFKYEKSLFVIFRDFKIDRQIGQLFMKNGFTELFSSSIENSVRSCIND